MDWKVLVASVSLSVRPLVCRYGKGPGRGGRYRLPLKCAQMCLFWALSPLAKRMFYQRLGRHEMHDDMRHAESEYLRTARKWDWSWSVCSRHIGAHSARSPVCSARAPNRPPLSMCRLHLPHDRQLARNQWPLAGTGDYGGKWALLPGWLDPLWAGAALLC